MRTATAILLALALLAAQAIHGGLLIFSFAVPAYALLVLAGLAALVPLVFSKGRPDWVLVLAGLIPCGYLVWRTTWGPDLVMAQNEQGIVLGMAIVWLVMAGVLTGSAERLFFLTVLLLGCVIQGAFGIGQLASADLSAGGFWVSEQLQSIYEGKFPRRATGLYFNPNHFAWLMNAAAIFSLSLGVWGRLRPGVRILALYFTVVFVALGVFSASRGGLLSLAAGLTAFAVVSVVASLTVLRQRRVLILGGGLALTAVAVAAGLFVYTSSWVAQGRVGNTFIFEDIREQLNEHAWRLFQTAPAYGAGPGMFKYGARAYRSGNQPSDAMWVHDDWMQLLAEYGFVGFALVALVFLLLLARGLRGFFGPLRQRYEAGDLPFSNSAALALGAWCTAIAFGLHSVLDFNLHLPANALLAAAVVGMLVAPPRVREGASRGDGWWAKIPIVVGLVIVIAGMGWLLQRVAPADYHLLRANNALVRGDVDLALAETEAGLALVPDHPELLMARGQAHAEYETSKQAALDAATGDDEALIIDEPDVIDEEDVDEVEEEEVGPTFELTEDERRKFQEEAVKYYREALAGRPLEREYHIRLGNVLDELDRQPEALPHFRTAVSLDPFHGYVWGPLGDHYYYWDQVVRALESYRSGSWLPGGEYATIRIEIVQGELDPTTEDALLEEGE